MIISSTGITPEAPIYYHYSIVCVQRAWRIMADLESIQKKIIAFRNVLGGKKDLIDRSPAILYNCA